MDFFSSLFCVLKKTKENFELKKKLQKPREILTEPGQLLHKEKKNGPSTNIWGTLAVNQWNFV